ncbi:MAG: peptide-methionine (S)-S-oxide reductase MsrA [Mucilaginibacter sp.]|uniref:peptide-methionine (S)-S-oxide reductase MsrA n=1 Tax=Mucilaginibacter sp. TaxID=1882438 RepID=UPI003263BAE5
MEKVTAEMYQQNPQRYTLVDGSTEGAPTCAYGNVKEWVGYDKVERTFVRFTKSVYKKLVSQIDPADSVDSVTSNSGSHGNIELKPNNMKIENEFEESGGEVIYFAGGCFWGTEHFFKLIKGVIITEVGFANGKTKDPNYKEVVNGGTGFAETVKVTYDPEKVRLSQLLDLFFKTIDPTSVNRQGNDIGTQYRSGIYYTAEHQVPVITEVLSEIASQYNKPLAVEVKPLLNFYTAEAYHQNYLEENPGGYCHIGPELFDLARETNR